MMVIVFSLIFLALMLVVVWFDATRFVIPNWLNLLILLLFPVWFLLSPAPQDIGSSLLMFAILLGIGFVIFALRLMGGGDVKLLTVLGLYTGFTQEALHLIIFMALAGGVLSMVVIMLRVMLRRREHKPRIFCHKEPIPYGLAIAFGFAVLVLRGSLPGFGEVSLLNFL
jgi:prepilin peptidase CpaA